MTKKIIRFLFNFEDKILEQDICGIHFKNPIGLAAGFDKNADLTEIVGDLGFGFEEIGSITGEPYEGNPKPRLHRLPEDRALVINYGLKSNGAEFIHKKLLNKKFELPIGISIAKTNNAVAVANDGIGDYLKSFNLLFDFADYITINISCPNTSYGKPFTDPENLDNLLTKILAQKDKIKPIFLKMPPDLSEDQLVAIINVAEKHKIAGFICSNLVKDRTKIKVKSKILPEKGGISGKVIEEMVNNQIKFIYKKTNGKFIIIGCGGVFSAEDAYLKIKLGASLIQLITGMIYQGPQLINEINRGIVKLLKKDGFTNIKEAIGQDVIVHAP